VLIWQARGEISMELNRQICKKLWKYVFWVVLIASVVNSVGIVDLTERKRKYGIRPVKSGGNIFFILF
jgi:hypothetical protein